MSNDARMPSEMVSEMGSLDLVRSKKVISSLGETRFCWVMGKDIEFEKWLEAWMGSEEVEVMKEEETRCGRLQKWLGIFPYLCAWLFAVILYSYSLQEVEWISSRFNLGLVMWLAMTIGTLANVMRTETWKALAHWGLPFLLLWGTPRLPPSEYKPGQICWRPGTTHLCHPTGSQHQPTASRNQQTLSETLSQPLANSPADLSHRVSLANSSRKTAPQRPA